jgi:predicted nucleic acid-binding Zn ribbon protein
MRRNWQEAPIVTIPVYTAACPECGAAKPIHVRGQANGDESTTELVVCRRCSLPFKVVRELQTAELGNLELTLDTLLPED